MVITATCSRKQWLSCCLSDSEDVTLAAGFCKGKVTFNVLLSIQGGVQEPLSVVSTYNGKHDPSKFIVPLVWFLTASNYSHVHASGFRELVELQI